MFEFGGQDINWWYSHNKGVCNHCGADMNKFHPLQNIYPHFTGACCPQKIDTALTLKNTPISEGKKWKNLIKSMFKMG